MIELQIFLTSFIIMAFIVYCVMPFSESSFPEGRSMTDTLIGYSAMACMAAMFISAIMVVWKYI